MLLNVKTYIGGGQGGRWDIGWLWYGGGGGQEVHRSYVCSMTVQMFRTGWDSEGR